MPKLLVRNLTNSPQDLEGGIRLPAMGTATGDFTDHYASLLRGSPGVEVEPVLGDPVSAPTPNPPASTPHAHSNRGSRRKKAR